MRWSRSEIPLLIFVVLCLISVVQYSFSLLGFLPLANYMIWAFFIVFLIKEVPVLSLVKFELSYGRLYEIFKCKKVIFYYALGLLFPLFYFLYSIPLEFHFTGDDNFSHWALSSKYIYLKDELYGGGSSILFKNYPPGSAVYQYLFLNVLGFSEKKLLLANHFFILAGIAAVWLAILRRNSNLALLGYWFSVLLVPAFGYSWFYAYVDLPVGVLFAVGVAIFYRYGISVKGVFLVVPVIAMLVLTKQIGLAFSFIICTFYVVHVVLKLFFLILRRRSFFFKKREKEIYSKALLASFLMYFVPVLIYLSWAVYLHCEGVEGGLPALEISPLDYQRKLEGTINEFVSRIFSKGYFNDFIPTFWMCICLFSSGVLQLVVFKRLRGRYASLFLCFTSGCAVYVVFLMYSYLNFFSEYESVRLASFERYVGSYLLPWLVVSTAIAVNSVAVNKKASWTVLFAIATGLTSVYSVGYIKKNFTPPNDIHNRDLRDLVLRLSEIVRFNSREDDKIYYISQKSRGYDKLMFHYYISPLHSSRWCWSLGKPYYEGDVWTCDKSFEEALEGYSILVLARPDSRFWQEFGHHFDEKDRGEREGVYRIRRDKSNRIRLVHLPRYQPNPVLY